MSPHRPDFVSSCDVLFITVEINYACDNKRCVETAAKRLSGYAPLLMKKSNDFW